MDIKLDYSAMRKVCLEDANNFKKLGKVIETPTKGILVHIDRGSPILAVAHLDSVQYKKHFYKLDIGDEEWVMSPQLDDRLGVYIILHLLPQLGINVDVLLTDDEEIGQSTAQYFESNKQYNWMVEFDRMGSDSVYYQYGDNAKFFKKRLAKAGFNNMSRGINTDICYLEHLGIKGFNVGVGYEDYHSKWAKANMTILRAQIGKFINFYKSYKDVLFYHKPKHYAESVTHYGGGGHSYMDDMPPFPTTNKITTTSHNKSKDSYTEEGWIFENNKWKKVGLKFKNEKLMCSGDCDRVLTTLEIKKSKLAGYCIFCEATHFECLGCGEVNKAQEMKGDTLCANCYSSWLDNPQRFLTVHMCIECHEKALNLYEVKSSMTCFSCEMLGCRNDY